MNQLDLTGRHAVVTGGAAGLGLAIANRILASQGQVTLWDKDAARLIKARESLLVEFPASQVDIMSVDVASYESVAQASVKTLALKVVDILVNCAGITGLNTTMWDYPIQAWRDVMDVNVNGLFYCCKELSSHMKDRGFGRIVNVASVAGKDGNPNASAYSASKAAVIGLTKSLGKELAETGVLVNCVTPAAVKTALFDQMSAEHIQFMLSKIPMGRFGLPEEVAALVCWLCTEDCSFSTGAVFDLSGGRATY